MVIDSKIRSGNFVGRPATNSKLPVDDAEGKGQPSSASGFGATSAFEERTSLSVQSELGAAATGPSLDSFETVTELLTAPTHAHTDALESLYARLETPTFVEQGQPLGEQVEGYARAIGLSEIQVDEIDCLLNRAPAETVLLVGALLEKHVDLLSMVDSQGQTTLNNLARIAQQPLHPHAALDTTKQELLAAVLSDLINPQRIDQGDAPVCTASSVQFELVVDQPAEYVRLLADLSSPSGQATMRGEGQLVLERGDANALPSCSASQSLFQTALIAFANGRTAEFAPYPETSLNFHASTPRALGPAAQKTVLHQLFGVRYEMAPLAAASFAQAIEQFRNGNQNRPVSVELKHEGQTHQVMLERVEEHRIFFRDASNTLRSGAVADFAQFAVAIDAPQELKL